MFQSAISKTEWWQRKLGYNEARDWQHQRELELLGWRIIVVWECELKPARRMATLHSLKEQLTAEVGVDADSLLF